ncbi:hypothetical protein [Paenibacillus sp. SN-8-1]
MTQWALEHPLLTSMIAIFAIMAVSNVANNFAQARFVKHLNKSIRKEDE